MWITIFVVVLLNGNADIIYSQPEHKEACEKKIAAFYKDAVVEVKSGNIRSVNATCVPINNQSKVM